MTKTTIMAARDIGKIVQTIGLDVLMDELIARIHLACQDFESGSYSVPVRSGFHFSQPVTGLIEWMPAMQRGRKTTMKMVTYYPTNPAVHRLPTILSSMLVFDTLTGHLDGIMDSTFLTALRTGAASAVASRVLARSDSSTLGLIGCGAQSVAQLHALSRVFRLRKILIYDVDHTVLDSFSRRIRYLHLNNLEITTATPEQIVAQSDILCTCTSINIGEGPIFQDISTKKHIHINAVGSDFPGKTELPRSLLARSLVCPDFQAQAIAEGECQQLGEDEIGANLTRLLLRPDMFEAYRDKSTVFDSTGWALEDHVACEMLIGHADRLEIGEKIELECISADPKDPYGFAMEGSSVEDIQQISRKLAAAD